ncbi:MAG TPA: type II secretion system F family protein [Clostridiales bacterium]|nr:type II secretion system F family protein [Clostridiales bacterium]
MAQAIAPILAALAILVPTVYYTFPRSERRSGGDLQTILTRTGVRFVNDENRDALRMRLMQAGLYAMTPEQFMGIRVLLTGSILPLFLILLPFRVDVAIVVALFLAPALYIAPTYWLSRKIRARQSQARAALGEFTLLLSVALEAGADVRKALREASRVSGGPLREEIDRALSEEATGVPLTDALTEMTLRLEVEELRVLVRTIVQSYRYGAPLAQMMRESAERMGMLRRYEIMEASGRLQVALLFPVLFFILGPMMVVLMYPALMRLMEVF